MCLRSDQMFGRKKKDKRFDVKFLSLVAFRIQLLELTCEELEKKMGIYKALLGELLIERITKDIETLRDRGISERVVSFLEKTFQNRVGRFDNLSK